ncbi:MAG TPA: MFS transporter [Ignavibacteria bacterium]|nr:MFS transporter [Ignavibacteria bacterium]
MEFWRKNLYSIWFAQFFAMIGMSMVIPFLPFYVRELGVTDPKEVEHWSGLVFAAPFILSFIFTPIWGSVGDKYGRKPMVLRACFGLAISQLLIGLSANVYQLLVFRMVQGGVSGFIAASLALVSASTPKEKSGYAIGILQTSISAGTVIGPLIGGFLADITSHRNVFFITSVICLISGFMVWINVKEPVREFKPAGFSLFKNVEYAFKNKKLILALTSISLVTISISLAQPIFALFIETFEIDFAYMGTITGSIFGITGIFTVISSPWWGKRVDRKGYKKNILVAMSCASAAYFLHNLVPIVYLLYPVRAFLGFCVGGLVPVFYSYISKNAPEDRKGGMMGIASSFTLFGNMIGPLLCSAIVFKIHLHHIFWFSGAIMLINTLYIYFKFTDYKTPIKDPDIHKVIPAANGTDDVKRIDEALEKVDS